MDTLGILKDEFFVNLQRELETKQEYLSSVLNPNEYLVIQTEINLLRNIIDNYVHYLEGAYHDGVKVGTNK